MTKPFSVEELQSKVENIIRLNSKQKNKIAEAELRYQYALDNMLEGCQIIGHDWQYLYINDSGAKFGHTSKDGIIGKKVFEVYPNIVEQPIYGKLKNCLENKVRDHLKPKMIIIAQTAYASASDIQERLAAGCNDYFSKPINSQKLFELLNKYLPAKASIK